MKIILNTTEVKAFQNVCDKATESINKVIQSLNLETPIQKTSSILVKARNAFIETKEVDGELHVQVNPELFVAASKYVERSYDAVANFAISVVPACFAFANIMKVNVSKYEKALQIIEEKFDDAEEAKRQEAAREL